MSKVKSKEDLIKIKNHILNKEHLSGVCEDPENAILIKVAMATCGIASGAKDLMEYLIKELDKRRINAIVSQTGCMGYCYAEPTIEITMPGERPVVYGYVDNKKADEIMETHIIRGDLVNGFIPNNYETIEL